MCSQGQQKPSFRLYASSLICTANAFQLNRQGRVIDDDRSENAWGQRVTGERRSCIVTDAGAHSDGLLMTASYRQDLMMSIEPQAPRLQNYG